MERSVLNVASSLRKRKMNLDKLKMLWPVPLIWNGLAIINRTNKTKNFDFYDGEKLVLRMVLGPKGAYLSNDDLFSACKFSEPISLGSLAVSAGRKWDITINEISGDDVYRMTKYY